MTHIDFSVSPTEKRSDIKCRYRLSASKKYNTLFKRNTTDKKGKLKTKVLVIIQESIFECLLVCQDKDKVEISDTENIHKWIKRNNLHLYKSHNPPTVRFQYYLFNKEYPVLVFISVLPISLIKRKS